jgi:hypothetical protein
MRFAKLHPSFLIFFFLSLASLGVALALGIASADECSGTGSTTAADGHCAIEARGESTLAMVFAIGGLTAMLGGIGFQIGRARPTAPSVPAAGPQQTTTTMPTTMSGAPTPWPGAAGFPPSSPQA